MNKTQPARKSDVMNQLGFTLIELSIVLVIIGLIVGGVLVGQDLIKAAEIRATVAQIEKYNTAVNTFQGKFNGLPGDLPATTAAAFGLYAQNAGAGGTGRGDGNGLIDGSVSTSTVPAAYTQEGVAFWVHLSQANLLDGNFASIFWDSAPPVTIATAASISEVFPLARIGRGNYIVVGSASGQNYYMITGIASSNGATSSGILNTTANLTPIEAYNMDVKLDDGAPETGIVQAHGLVTNSTTTLFTDPSSYASPAASGSCLVSTVSGLDTSATYNRNLTSGGNTPSCSLRFRFN